MVAQIISLGILFFINSIAVDANAPNHALHLSTIEVEHTVNAKTATIRIKVFEDDFRDALRLMQPKGAFAASPNFFEKHKGTIKDYWNQHFSCSINDEFQRIELIHCEVIEDIYLFEFRMYCPPRWSTISLKANHLMELFADQSNMGMLQYDGFIQHFRLTPDKSIFTTTIP